MLDRVHEQRLADWVTARNGKIDELRWRRRGAGGETRGVRLVPETPRVRAVFAHATGNDALFPQTTLFHAMLTAGIEVLTFDLDGHGHGSTTQLVESAFGEQLSDAIGAAGWRNGRRPHLVGQSLGAALCLHDVARGRIDAASLTLATMPLRVSLDPRAALVELGSPLRASWWAQVRHYGAYGIVPAFGRFKRAEYPVRLGEAARKLGDYIAAVQRLIADWRLLDAAAHVQCPTLLLSGERDLIAPVSDAERVKQAISGARGEIVAGETHFTTLLRADACAKVAEFIARAGGTQG